jgi:hypothetical protein
MNSSNGNTRNWIRSRTLRTRQTVALVISTCALALGVFTASAAPDFANVTTVNFRPGGRNFDLTVSILTGLHDAASRTSGGDFDVRVMLRYISAANTVETIDSGRIPIRTGTSFIGPIDNRTVAIGLVLPLGRHPAPANHFSTTTAAQVRRATPLRDKWWCYF